jgi:phage N-6-adenine-methyltransferase
MEQVQATNGRTGPSMNKGRSKQDYGTERPFLDAVEKRFGMIRHDLAASAENAVCENYYDEHRDSFAHDWRALRGVLWLNPPFANIAPWAAKCAESASPTTRILLLVPASVGSNWFAEHVHGKAIVLFLNPRIKFVGMPDPYPKDLILACYGMGAQGFDVWRWKQCVA